MRTFEFSLPLRFPAEWLWQIWSSKSPRNHFGIDTAQFGRVNYIAIDSRHRSHRNTAMDSNRCRRAIVPKPMTPDAVLSPIWAIRKSLGKSEIKKEMKKLELFDCAWGQFMGGFVYTLQRYMYIFFFRVFKCVIVFITNTLFTISSRQGIHSHSTPLSLLRWTINFCLIARYDYYINVFIFGRETKVDQCIHNIRPFTCTHEPIRCICFGCEIKQNRLISEKDESVWHRTNFRIHRFCCFFIRFSFASCDFR